MSAPSWPERPTFLWGIQKSGSTLLRGLFDGHPSLVVYATELHIKYFLGRKSREGEAELRGRYLREEWRGEAQGKLKVLSEAGGRGSEPLLEKWGPDVFDAAGYARDLAAALRAPIGHPKELLTRDIVAFYRNMRRPPADPVGWVFKMVGGSPAVVEAFLSSFPEGRLIYIARDPRAVANSRLKDWARKGRQWEEAALLAFLVGYRHQEDFVAGLRRRTPADRLMVVRYEDLVRDTETVMRRACDFVGVPFDPIVLEPTALGRPSRMGTATVDKAGVFDDSLADWERRLPARARWLTEIVFRSHLGEGRCGYSSGMSRLGAAWGALRLNMDRALLAQIRSAVPSYVSFGRI